MKILVVVDSIDINDSSGSKANVALIKNLIKAEFYVKVYHYTQRKIELPNVECIAIPELKWNIYYVLSRVQRLFTRYTKININPFIESKLGFSFTFFNDVRSIKKCLEKEVNFNPDLILTLSKGMSFRPHKALLKLSRFHSKWLAYVHDPYPYHHYPIPYKWIEPGYKIKESFFKEVSEKAKFSAFPSKLLLEWMGNYYPNFISTGIVVPHQIYKQNHQQVDFSSLNFVDTNKFNILHAGSLIGGRSPEGLIKAFKMFIKNNPLIKEQVRLFLIGNNAYYKEWMDSEINDYDGIIVININLPFDVVYELQHQVAVNVILEANTVINPFLPGKFPHCVKANRPILALTTKNSELMRLLGENYKYWSNPDDVQNISNTIKSLYQKWKNNKDSFKLDRTDLEHYVSVENLKSTFENILRNCN